MDDQIKRVFAITLAILFALWLGSYVYGQIKLNQATQHFNHNSYQPLRGNQ
jgi:hypothetical protein